MLPICSVCNEKLALQATVDKLLQEKKQLYAEKMSEFFSCLVLIMLSTEVRIHFNVHIFLFTIFLIRYFSTSVWQIDC